MNCRVMNRFYSTLVELFGECISDCHNIEIVVVCALIKAVIKKVNIFVKICFACVGVVD